MKSSVVLGEWLDRPLAADLAVAAEAARLGYPELWIGEMAKLDAPAMAATVVSRTERIEPCLGPYGGGDHATVQRRIDEYAAAGVAEIGLVVPPLDLPSGGRTLDALAPR